jgi:hypothetical protein
MAYNILGDTLVQGVNLQVYADFSDESGSGKELIGFVQDASMRKNIGVQRAEVIGELLPVSLDPQSVQTTVTLRGFIPSKNFLDNKGGSAPWGDGSAYLKEFNPDESKIIDTLSFNFSKIPYLELYDKKSKSVVGYTNWAIVTSFGESTSGKGYLAVDITLEGIGYSNGIDYPTRI